VEATARQASGGDRHLNFYVNRDNLLGKCEHLKVEMRVSRFDLKPGFRHDEVAQPELWSRRQAV
jgi:hypothetical protein